MNSHLSSLAQNKGPDRECKLVVSLKWKGVDKRARSTNNRQGKTSKRERYRRKDYILGGGEYIYIYIKENKRNFLFFCLVHVNQ
jgi:hypothetical protein